MTTPGFTERLARLTPAQREALERLLDERRATTAATAPSPADGRPRNATEEALARIWAECLGVPVPSVHDGFWALGGDSIIGMQIAARAAAEGIAVSPQQVLEAETVARLAELATTGEAVRDEADQPLGEVPLTPIQRWFFEQDLPGARHWDQTLYLPVRRALDPELLHRALCAVAAHHDVLRSAFRQDAAGGGDGWRHEVRSAAPDPPLTVVRLPEEDGAARRAREDAAVESAQRSLDLADGPLVAAVLLQEDDGPAGPGRLVLVAHHLVVDGISLRLLTDDLERAYRALEGGREPILPARTTSFRRWAQLLRRWADHPDVAGQLPYWRSVPDASAAALPFTAPDEPGEGPRANTIGRSATVRRRLGQDVTEALLRDAPARGLSPLNLLLAALLRAWPRSPGATELQLDLEAHGREVVEGGANVSRTVGWFTSIFPVRLPLPSAAGGDPAEEVADEVATVGGRLDAVPHRGLGYGLLRYLSGAPGARLAELPQSRLSFNYLGRFERSVDDAVFGAPAQVPSVLQSPDAPRRYLLELVVTAVERELVVELTHARDQLPDEAAEALTETYVRHIGELTRQATGGTGARTGGVAEDQLAAIKRRMGMA
ncbi:condensation domain-containing protein [Streptomyces malaysiensis]|uniref:condensation domain-containing protein n=1 Tax=Streptomyces malaysiensis TaxID=92644 RepID=UPI00369F489A